MNPGWETMLRSVERRRDVDARYYKPVCLIAVIDGIADGSLAASDLDPDRVRARFKAYVAPLFPDRADMGWRPFWHLSRDGAWIFHFRGKEVGPEDFKQQRKPNSPRELMSRIDHVFVPPEMRDHWRSPEARSELRAAAIAMLARDNEDCRRLAALLEAPENIVETDWPNDPAPATDKPANASRQGFSTSLAVRQAIERHAVARVESHLAAQGWQLEDVSARRSYDLHATRGAETLFVEVKGTQGSGDQIRVTAAEVAFATTHQPRMLLAVLAQIHCQEQSDGAVIAKDGELRLFHGWAPRPGDLAPVSFFCDVTRATDPITAATFDAVTGMLALDS